jgi:hypothetical protein
MLRWRHPHSGRLLQPRHYGQAAETAAAGIPWAADNDCYQGLNEAAYTAMLDAIAGVPGCLFVTAPDVVGEHGLTDLCFEEWAPRVHMRGLPAAYVLQEDGPEYESRPIPWGAIDALFIGFALDDNKLGTRAAQVAREAKRRGKWVHWGRVNSERRITYVKSTGACDSFDGTGWAKWRDANLPRGLAAAAAPTQLALESA